MGTLIVLRIVVVVVLLLFSVLHGVLLASIVRLHTLSIASKQAIIDPD
jgi:uncharacterized membrane protein